MTEDVGTARPYTLNPKLVVDDRGRWHRVCFDMSENARRKRGGIEQTREKRVPVEKETHKYIEREKESEKECVCVTG